MTGAPREAPVVVPPSLASTRLLLVRHGQTVWHRENRYAGADSDIDLTAVGREQAQQLARWAERARPDAVVSSPVRRAVETAQPSAVALGMPLQTVEDLREVGFGLAEGLTIGELTDLDAGMVDRFRSDPVQHPFPGAERPEAAAQRARAALREVAAARSGSTVLVVAHNTLLRLALCAFLDLPVNRYREVFPRLDNAAVTELRVPVDPSRPCSLCSLNVPVTAP